MAKQSEEFLFLYDKPVGVVVAGVPGRAKLGALKGALAVFDDYTKRTRTGLTKEIGARFRVGAHVFGDLSKATDDTEVAFVAGVCVAKAEVGQPVELSSGTVRQALAVIGRRWLTLGAFESADLTVEHDYQGWVVAAGPKASARVAVGSAAGKKAAATATAKKPGVFDGEKHAMGDYFLVATAG